MTFQVLYGNGNCNNYIFGFWVKMMQEAKH